MKYEKAVLAHFLGGKGKGKICIFEQIVELTIFYKMNVITLNQAFT